MNKAWHYSDGKWALGDDPLLDALLDAQAADQRAPTPAVLRKLEYLKIFSVGQRWQAGFELWECEDG
jgi:hypothetical protein